ncbi:MAG TPA: phosphoenolpyruvate carboxykinase domain-containing protein, partial [Solirubrobacteraceae bacterium]
GIDTGGLEISDATMRKLLEVDDECWKEQVSQMREHYARFGTQLPTALRAQFDSLQDRLGT